MQESMMSKIGAWYDHYHRLTHAALIVLVGMMVYGGTLNVPFIFDDYICIKNNPTVANFSYFTDYSKVRALNIESDIKNSFALRPVVYLTFALNHKVGGFDVRGYHLINTLIHLTNALLIYLLVRFTVRRENATTTVTASTVFMDYFPLLVALPFVVHPLQTQAVTYIVQRFTSLATLFYLTALLLYIAARTALPVWRQRFYYVAALMVTVVAMKSKEIAFTLPVVMVLYDFYFLSGDVRRRLFGLIPFFLTMAIIPLTLVWLTTLQEGSSASVVDQSMNLVNFAKVSRWDYLITEFGVMVVYLRMLILPFGQNLDHDYRLAQSFFEPQVIGSFLLLLALVASAVFAYLRARKAAPSQSLELKLFSFGIMWFFVTLSVESSIIPIDDLLAEHRVYLPSVGFLIATVAGVHTSFVLWWSSIPGFRVLLVGLSAIIVIALTFASFSRNQIWRDPVTLWEDSVSKSPRKLRPNINLTGSYLSQGRYPEAMIQLSHTRSLPAATEIEHVTMSRMCNTLDMIDAAIEEMKIVIVSKPQEAYYRGVLGQLYLNRGDIPAAIASFEACLRLNQDDFEVQSLLNQLQSPSVQLKKSEHKP